MADENGDYVWQPPTPGELKIIQAKRERDNKISQRMGDYLLKGYKMLGSVCTCGTILLQDKQGSNYCIACQELDSDVDKDDPATNPTAAQSQVREQNLSSCMSLEDEDMQDVSLGAAAPSRRTIMTAPCALPQKLLDSLPTLPSRTMCRGPENAVPLLLTNTATALTDKLVWATDELTVAKDIDYNIKLCQLIKHCVEALQLIKTPI